MDLVDQVDFADLMDEWTGSVTYSSERELPARADAWQLVQLVHLVHSVHLVHVVHSAHFFRAVEKRDIPG